MVQYCNALGGRPGQVQHRMQFLVTNIFFEQKKLELRVLVTVETGKL